MERLRRRGLRPIQYLPLGFSVVILTGTLLLMLPIASTGERLPFLSALFTATSATCVTGLIVVDTGAALTVFGQAVVLLLIQIGGLGFMTMAALLFITMGKRISLRERLTIAEALSAGRLQGVLGLVLKAVKITFAIELTGALLLMFRFIPDYGVGRGIWFSIFHAVSAFCNAGFDVFGTNASLTGYAGDVLVNVVIMALIVLGGLGFAVVAQLAPQRRRAPLTLHAKLALSATAVMLFLGFVLFTALEWDNPKTLGAMPYGERLLAGMFQSVTTRTAGFDTMGQSGMREITKFISTLFMSVGAAPAGTGGGIKVTTMALVFLSVKSVLRSNEDVEVFSRRVSRTTVRRAQTIMLVYLCMILLFTILIDIIELNSPASAFSLVDEGYEVASAFGTVGLTAGVTALASPPSLVLLIIGMFLGRVGPLTMMLALTGRQAKRSGIQYPERDVLVG